MTQLGTVPKVACRDRSTKAGALEGRWALNRARGTGIAPAARVGLPSMPSEDENGDDASARSVEREQPHRPTRTPPSPVRTGIQRAVLFAPVGLLVACALARRWMDDDGFINLRVVRNLLAGDGPVYNVGERVEVFTSSLWIGLLAVLGALGLRLEHAAVFGGIALGGVGLGLAVHAAVRSDEAWSREASSGFRWPLGAAVVAVLPPAWDYASSGLETGLAFGWLGGAYALTLAALDAPGSRKAKLAAVVVGLGPLVRPELALYTLAFFLPLAYEALARSDEGRPWRSTVALVGCALAAPLAYEIFRMAYFAALTPNTAIAKEAFRANVPQGLCYWRNFVGLYALAVPFTVLAIFAVSRVVGTIPTRRLVLVTPIVAAALHAGYVVRMGGDYMHGRMFLPAVFAAAMPVAAVRVPRPRKSDMQALALAVATVPLLAWLVVCGTRLRVDRENVCGIGDERGWYARIAEVPRPTLLSDYARHTFYVIGADLAARLEKACGPKGGEPKNGEPTNGEKPACRKLFLDDEAHGALVPRRSTYDLSDAIDRRNDGATVGTAIGIAGYLLPSSVHLVDRLGLADPIGSRMAIGARGRPGHEKSIGNAWIVARFARPEPIDDASVAAARHALSCGELAELVRATRGPLTIERALRNVVASFGFQRMRISRDPFAAEETFCRTQPLLRSIQAGGNGGAAFVWPCPLGTHLASLSGSVATDANAIATLRAVCRPDANAGASLVGPPFGKAAKVPFESSCWSAGGVVGIRGRVRGVVRRLRAVCADGTEAAEVGGSEAGEGDDPGKPFETTCPDGTRAIGIAGRSGALVDAVGLVCGSEDRR